MAKRQNFIVGSTNTNTEAQTVTQLNEAWDRYDVLYSGKLDGVFNAVSDYSNDSSNEIANAILSITGSQPTGQSQTELAGALNQMRQDIETSSLTFKGYISTTEPSSSTYGLIEGNLWINSATLPTSFPVAASSIQVWNGTAWVAQSDSYTVANFDFWRNINDNEGYYWFGGQWVVMSTDMSTTYFTLNQTSGKWEIKSSVNLPGQPTAATPTVSSPDEQIATKKYIDDALLDIASADLFDYKWRDATTNKAGWKEANSFSWINRADAQSGYDHLATEYSNAMSGAGTWSTPAADTNLGENSWHRVIWDGTRYIALGSTGYISTSTDGVTWSAATAVAELGDNRQYNGFAYNGSIYLALGKTGYISTSADGTTWTQSAKNTQIGSHEWMALASDGNGKFVAVGNTGYVSTSTDGVNWSTPVQDTNMGSHTWDALSYLNGQFVAMGNTGYISTSADGSTWTTSYKGTNIGTKSYQSITYNGYQYFALGYGGWISRSTDLVNWTTPSQLIDSYSWVDLVCVNGKILALSATGYLATNTYGTINTETVAGITISYVETPDGHKIVATDQETNVAAIYTATGVSWYYIIDTQNQRFKLPRINPAKEEIVTSYPIKGSIGTGGGGTYFVPTDTDFTQYTYPSAGGYGVTVTSNQTIPGASVDTNNATTVYAGKKYLYFYVGK